MTSKNLYFKLMKEDLKRRSWVVALISLLFFFGFPVVAAIRSVSNNDMVNGMRALEYYQQNMNEVFSFFYGLMPFFIILMATVCGLSSFSYLNSKSKVDFYHGIPVKRETLYIANYLNGIFIMIIPYCIMVMLGLIVATLNGANGILLWKIASQSVVLNSIYYILIYSTVIIAVMLTGNFVVSILGMAVFCGIVPFTTAIVQAYFSVFFQTYVEWNYMDIITRWLRISPVAEYVYQMGTLWDNGNKNNVIQMPMMDICVAGLIGITLGVLGGILYKKRPSEAAERSIAFQVSKPIINVAITLVSSISFGLFFWFIHSSTGWAIFGILCGGIIAHCIIEIIFHSDFRKLFSHKVQLGICLFASIALFGMFRYDWLGYDTYLPKETQVKEAAVSIDRLNNWESYGDTVLQSDGSYEWERAGKSSYVFDQMKGMDSSTILALAEAEIYKRGEDQSAYVDIEGIEELYSDVIIQYILNNGEKVMRRYYISIDKYKDLFEAVHSQQAYKEGTYPVMTMAPDQVAAVSYNGIYGSEVFTSWTEDEKRALLKAYQEDFYDLTLETMRKEMPEALVRFMRPVDVAGIAWLNQQKDRGDYSGLQEQGFYPIYPSFTRTKKILKSYDIDPRQEWTDMQVQELKVFSSKDNDTKDVYMEGTIIYVTEEETKELIKILQNENLENYNSLYERALDFRAEITYVKKGINNELIHIIGGIFPNNQVPEFVKARLTNK